MIRVLSLENGVSCPARTRLRICGAAVLFALALVGTAPVARADGLMMPPVVQNGIPEIPSQRALITFRDGMETMVVETAFSGQGGDVAWLLPVPAKPVAMAKASPGVFSMLTTALQPDVRYGANRRAFLLLMPLAVWTFFLIALDRFAPVRALACAVLFFALPVLASLLVPPRFSGFASLSGGMAGVRASDAERIGDYEVRVLEADSADALSTWLSENGHMGLPEKGLAVTEDYVARNWSFVAARLVNTPTGAAQPHPLSLTFPVESPVYPMRLTQLADTDLHLDLYVVADGRAATQNMQCTYCARFFSKGRERNQEASSRRMIAELGETHGWLRFRRTLHRIVSSQNLSGNGTIALPALVDMLWDGCVITHLDGDLKNGLLGRDFEIQVGGYAPERGYVYTKAGSRWRALEVGGLLGVILLAIGVIRHYRRPVQSGRGLRRAVTLAGGAGTAVGILLLAATPTVPDVSEDDFYTYYLRTGRFILEMRSSGAFRTADEAREHLRRGLSDLKNPYTGEPFTFEEGPGEFTVHDAGTDVPVLCEYDASGAESCYSLSPEDMEPMIAFGEHWPKAPAP